MKNKELFDELRSLSKRLNEAGFFSASYFATLAGWATDDDTESIMAIVKIEPIVKEWHRLKSAKLDAIIAGNNAILSSISRQNEQLSKEIEKRKKGL